MAVIVIPYGEPRSDSPRTCRRNSWQKVKPGGASVATQGLTGAYHQEKHTKLRRLEEHASISSTPWPGCQSVCEIWTTRGALGYGDALHDAMTRTLSENEVCLPYLLIPFPRQPHRAHKESRMFGIDPVKIAVLLFWLPPPVGNQPACLVRRSIQLRRGTVPGPIGAAV